MLNCFTTQYKDPIPVSLVSVKDFPAWLSKQNPHLKNWLTSTGFCGEAGGLSLIPDAKGQLDHVLFCISDPEHFWSVGGLPFLLPEGVYRLTQEKDFFAIAWGLGAYQFTRYKKTTRKPAQLLLSKAYNSKHIQTTVESIYTVRDLINTPMEEMGPTELANASVTIAKENNATIKHIIGEDLLKKNFPLIHAVGRASHDAPRLIDFSWGNKKHPKVTLVGKGVCFDTGGLDLKPSSAMLLMKKDMGGAAHVLGLARMIMQAKLPVYLRVLIPAVENAVSGNAYRPGDILKSKKGLTIEIGNTDAEGRLVLADALTEAVSDEPDLLIDIATLTGAARVALGTELPAFFCNQESLAEEVIAQATLTQDPIWRMPLFSLYRDMLNTPFADINNCGADSYGGAITAALFLKEFVPDTIPWMHFDLMAWNLKTRPGRPQGGEAMALRALFGYLSEKF
jgi:leucyl aminopeptidase